MQRDKINFVMEKNVDETLLKQARKNDSNNYFEYTIPNKMVMPDSMVKSFNDKRELIEKMNKVFSENEKLDNYAKTMLDIMERNGVSRKSSELIIKSYTYGGNDVLDAATTAFYHLFKAMLTDGLTEGSDQYAKMENDAIRHTKSFRELIIELSKIEEILLWNSK